MQKVKMVSIEEQMFGINGDEIGSVNALFLPHLRDSILFNDCFDQC
jgi:hypothetical protein